MNGIKDENHMSITCREAFGEIQPPFIIKALKKLEI
jgi:hypothetical protein